MKKGVACLLLLVMAPLLFLGAGLGLLARAFWLGATTGSKELETWTLDTLHKHFPKDSQ